MIKRFIACGAGGTLLGMTIWCFAGIGMNNEPPRYYTGIIESLDNGQVTVRVFPRHQSVGGDDLVRLDYRAYAQRFHRGNIAGKPELPEIGESYVFYYMDIEGEEDRKALRDLSRPCEPFPGQCCLGDGDAVWIFAAAAAGRTK